MLHNKSLGIMVALRRSSNCWLATSWLLEDLEASVLQHVTACSPRVFAAWRSINDSIEDALDKQAGMYPEQLLHVNMQTNI